MNQFSFTTLPKTELHLHLEGSIPLSTQLELINRVLPKAKKMSAAALKEKFHYRNFSEFVSIWKWKNSFIKDYEDFTWIAHDLKKELHEQGVWYAEIHYSPSSFLKRMFELQKLSMAIRKGFDSCETSYPIIKLIVDLVRDNGSAFSEPLLPQIDEVKGDAGIAAIGLGGTETSYPSSEFSKLFSGAARLGLRRVAHSGETTNAKEMYAVINDLGVERIGHGIACSTNPALMDYLTRHNLPLEICVSSNVQLGIVSTKDAHPVLQFIERGVPLTLSSDDTTMFNTNINQEYENLHNMGVPLEHLINIARKGFEFSFMEEHEKSIVLKRFDDELQSMTNRN